MLKLLKALDGTLLVLVSFGGGRVACLGWLV